MTWLSLAEIEQTCGGRWEGERPGERALEGVSWRSREFLRPRTLVIPKGKKLGILLQSSIDEDVLSSCVLMIGQDDLPPPGLSVPVLRVASLPHALLALARRSRVEYKGRIFGVTGSVGKTSTTALLQHLLSRQGSCCSNGNHNTTHKVLGQIADLGATDFAAIEIAAGAMRAAGVLRPHIGILTALAPAHIEKFGSLEGLADRKARLFSSLLPGGAAVINRDIPLFDRIAGIARRTAGRVVTFGRHPKADARLLGYDIVARQVHAAIHGEEIEYQLGMLGRHMAINSLGALGAVYAAGLDWRRAAADCADATIPPGRGDILQITLDDKEITLFDDSYNANPASMTAAIDMVGCVMPRALGRRVAVLADMLELGPDSARRHEELAEPLRRAGFARVYLSGASMEHLWRLLPPEMRGGKAETAAALLEGLRPEIADGDVLLLKGSHGTGLYRLVGELLKLDGRQPRLQAEQVATRCAESPHAGGEMT